MSDTFALLTELLALREQLRWRKYPEEVPEEYEMRCEVFIRTDSVVRTAFWWGEEEWGTYTGSVISWRPLPEPPKEKNEKIQNGKNFS